MTTADIGHVSYWAHLFSLQATMYAIVAEMEGMKADNQLRAQQGLSPSYPQSEFARLSVRLCDISEIMAKI